MKSRSPARLRPTAERTRIVYSSGQGAICRGCQRASAQCVCSAAPGKEPRASLVRVGRETQGRSGKGVTVISGLLLAAPALEALAKELKRRCGAGGTVHADRIEIQGEHRDALVAELSARGFAVKRSGG